MQRSSAEAARLMSRQQELLKLAAEGNALPEDLAAVGLRPAGPGRIEPGRLAAAEDIRLEVLLAPSLRLLEARLAGGAWAVTEEFSLRKPFRTQSFVCRPKQAPWCIPEGGLELPAPASGQVSVSSTPEGFCDVAVGRVLAYRFNAADADKVEIFAGRHVRAGQAVGKMAVPVPYWEFPVDRRRRRNLVKYRCRDSLVLSPGPKKHWQDHLASLALCMLERMLVAQGNGQEEEILSWAEIAPSTWVFLRGTAALSSVALSEEGQSELALACGPNAERPLVLTAPSFPGAERCRVVAIRRAEGVPTEVEFAAEGAEGQPLRVVLPPSARLYPDIHEGQTLPCGAAFADAVARDRQWTWNELRKATDIDWVKYLFLQQAGCPWAGGLLLPAGLVRHKSGGLYVYVPESATQAADTGGVVLGLVRLTPDFPFVAGRVRSLAVE